MHTKYSLPTILLFFLCLFHISTNLVWLALNTAPIPWDQAGHTRLAVSFTRYMIGSFEIANPLQISSYYPPLTHLFSALLMLILGTSVFVASVPVTFFFCAALAGIFMLTKALFKSEWAGFFSALLFSLLPVVYENSRWLLLDIPLTAWLVWAWYFLHKSKGFSDWPSLVKFSFTLIGVLLTKWGGIFYLIIPILASLSDWRQRGKNTDQLSRFMIVLLFAGTIAFPWYFVNLERLIEIGRIASKGEITDPQILLSWENYRFYFITFLNFQATLWPALALIIIFVIFFLKKNPHKLLFAIGIASSYFLFTFISNKDIRYTIPLLVPIGMIFGKVTADWFKNRQPFGILLSSATIIFLTVQFAILSFGLLPQYQRAWNLGPLGWIDYVNTGDIVVTPPQKDDTPNKKILADLAQRQEELSASIMVGIDQPYLNPSTLDLVITLKEYKQLSLEAPFDRTHFEDNVEIDQYLSRFQYFLIPTAEVGPDAVRHKQALQQVQEFVLIENREQYQILEIYQLPNSSGEVLLITKKS